MKRSLLGAILAVAFLATLSFASPTRVARADTVNAGTFIGTWTAISPTPDLGDAHLVIFGRDRIVGLLLTDPYDLLFCASSVGHPVAVRAGGFAVQTGPRTISGWFYYSCEDGTSGFKSASFTLAPSDINQMADSASHVWTRD